MDSYLKLYHAIILDPTKNKLGERVTILAESPLEAKKQLEKRYGKGMVFDLHNEEDANRPR